jgi:hypothetical protein
MACAASFMKPTTVHYVLTVEDSITYGRHFYCASTISDSIFGLVHSFVVGVGATNTLHESGTRTFLHRIMAMWQEDFTAKIRSPCRCLICSDF